MLELTIVKGIDIPIGDFKTSDAYVKVYGITNSSTFYFGKTKCAYWTLTPQWNQTILIPAVCSSRILLEMFDYDILSQDDYLGKIEIPISKLEPFGKEKAFKLTTIEITKKIPSIVIKCSKQNYNLQQFSSFSKQSIEYLIAFHEAPTKQPFLRFRELNENNEALSINRNVSENGTIVTQDSYSHSYNISIDRLYQSKGKIQFYLESYGKEQILKWSENKGIKTKLVIIGIPKTTAEIKTNDGIMAIIMEKPNQLPFLFMKPHKMSSQYLYKCDDSPRAFIVDKISEEYESIYTKFEKRIYGLDENSDFRSVYNDLSQLIAKIASNSTDQDSIMHMKDVSHLCDAFIEQIDQHKKTKEFKYEKECLLRAKLLITPTFYGPKQ